MKQAREIEKLLHWTYRDELPKGYREGKSGTTPAISPMFRYAALGGPIDNWSREPGFPLAMGTTPHPDALAVHAAVMGLEDALIQWPRGAELLLGELHDYLTDGEKFIAKALQVQVAALVTMHARMGNRPIWQMNYSVVRFIGRERKSALRKGRGRASTKLQGELRLSVSPVEILTARLEYFAWHAALCELARTLTGLIDHLPTPPIAEQQPWHNPEQTRILQSVGDQPMDARTLASGRLTALPPLPLSPKRRRVLPQTPSARHGDVRHMPLNEANEVLTMSAAIG